MDFRRRTQVFRVSDSGARSPESSCVNKFLGDHSYALALPGKGSPLGSADKDFGFLLVAL